MILQTRIEPLSAVYTIKPTGKVTQALTIPGQAMNLQYAMEQYKRGTLVERAKAFYEKEGMVMPDFANMSRIERLDQLATFRKQKAEAELSLNNQIKTFNNVVEKQKKQTKEKPERSSDGGGDPTNPV